MPIEGLARALCRRYLSGDTSPTAIASETLARVAREDQAIRAFAFIDERTTLAMAEASEARYAHGRPLGPLDGVPVTIKDTLNVAGWPTRRGSLVTSDAPVAADAVSIARLRAAGAVFLGKTTTPEFAWRGLTESPQTGVTRNPLDKARHAGGSSGGAAAATALGQGIIGIGTDAAGSVRIPAAFCGVVGYKPSFGAIPLDPYPAAFWQLPHIGPITRTVADAIAAVAAMGGPAPSDWRSLDLVPFSDRLRQAVDARGLRVGIASGIAPHLHPDIKRAWDDAITCLGAEFSIEVVDVAFDEARDVTGALYRLGCAYAVAQVPEEKRRLLDPLLSDFLDPVRDISTAQLVELQRRSEELASELAVLLTDKIDLLLTPTMPAPPPLIGSASGSDWLQWCPFTPLFNLTQGPAISLPWRAPIENTLPIGLQIGAAPGRDNLVVTAAGAIEDLSARFDRTTTRAGVDDLI